MYRAITELTNRGLLPDQMKDPSAQRFLYYGVDFADHVWDGPPEAPVTAAMSPASYALVDPNNPNTFLEFENFTGTHTIIGQAATNAGNPVALAFCNDLDHDPLQRCNRYTAGGFDTSFDAVIDVHIDVGSRVGIGNGFNGVANVVGTPFTDELLAQDPAADVFSCSSGGGLVGGLICPIGFTDYPNLQMNQPVRNTAAMLLRTYIRPWADLHVATDDLTPTIEDFALDNLYHYSLSDLSQFATPGSDPTISTAVITYPLLTKDIPDPPVDGDDIKSWVISNMQYQPAIGRTGYGAPTYGSILFQLARKFFEGSAAAPSITELPKAGNDIDGWHTGGMYGNAPLQSINLDFPHTYLGGNPFICLNGVATNYRDPCAQNPPSWPIWVLPPGAGTCTSVPNCGPTFFNALENQTPARSNRVGLILYLGWSAHMIEDLSLPHHASNWTSQEHQRQDNLGDLAALSDLQGQIDWSAEMKSDIDALLAQVTPDNVDTFCAQQTLDVRRSRTAA